MRFACAGAFILSAVFALTAGPARTGEENVDVYDLKYGMRYCAAPWCDNQEFIDTHFGIDATTGVVTKHVGNAPPVEVGYMNGGEEILFVSPPNMAPNDSIPPGPAVAAPQPWAGSTAPRPVATAPAPRHPPAAIGGQPRTAAPQGQPYFQGQQRPAQRRGQAYAQPAPPPRRPTASAAKQPAMRPMTGGEKSSARLPWWKAMWR